MKQLEILSVTVDYQKYFKNLLSEFNLKNYQWQWVVSDSGEIVFDNNRNKVKYLELNKITKGLTAGSVENIIHKAIINGKGEKLMSSYYSTQLLQRDLGIVFSAPITPFSEIYNQKFSFYCPGDIAADSGNNLFILATYQISEMLKWKV